MNTHDLVSIDPAHGILIDGRWRSGGSGLFEVQNPADRTLVDHVADGDLRDATCAVDAAAAAFDAWRATAPRERSDILGRAFALMHRDLDRLATIISLENGKSLADARTEVGYAAEFFRWFAEESVRPGGDYGSSPAGGTRTIVTHRPVGVAALITPWNFPAAMATRKIAPALAAGCTVVLRPASETPLTAIAVGHLLVEAGVPAGVVNIVPGTDSSGIARTWLSDPRVRKISFTGSTRVGTMLLKQAADRIVNASMELGGNAPFVVADDANLDAAVAGALLAKFRGGGQACTAANRFYVHAAVHDVFVARFGRAVEALTVGPAASGAEIGPLISSKAVDDLEKVVQEAVASGARVAHRAEVLTSAGWFYPPTVLVDVAPDADILETELFGPVAPIVRWHDEAELMTMINQSEMGLASYVFSGDLHRALRLAEGLDAGMVGVNRGLVSDPSAPFGGLKQSGLGREGAREGLAEFTETQYFSVAWA
ncbi:NAD-dependent succinate-semialdehyde dehydrogenase [Nocardioides sp. C4-1]|uniref:NAD-dependent succinate-semialdehyde dehydrogenase n=1 Tax=Nocardioides sp. C4-1 TaxID=3151851 RepID=UPI0032653C37